MIYAASLNIPVKKALGKQVMQSNLNKICSQMNLDPDVTQMDVVIFGPRDVQGPKREQVQSAIDKKHPDLCVIYLYEKDGESDFIDCEYKKQAKKIKDSIVREAFEEFVGQHKIRAGKQKLSSADFDTPDSDSIYNPADETQQFINNMADIGATVNKEPEPEPVQFFAPPSEETEETKEPFQFFEPVEEVKPELEIPPIDTSFFTEPPVNNLDTQTTIPNPLEKNDDELPPIEHTEKIEDMLSNLNSFEDWELFKHHLNRDTIVKHLINENSEYVGLIQMLEVLDKRIETVWRDPALTADMKFDKIKAIGLERAVVRASTNSINVEKVISIISTIVLAAKRTVEEKVAGIDAAVYKITTDKNAIMDTSYIDRAIEERSKVQMSLLNLSRGIVDLYKSIDTLVVDEIAELDRHLPSANQFINEMVKPIGTQIFTPVNTAALVNKLMKALQENRVVASQLEEMVNAVIETLFALCEKDEEIIRYQQNKINLLKANRVEDVVVPNSLLKKSMFLFTGAENTGLSATAITWSGIMSRRNNVLLLDLTGKSKFREYGIEPIHINDFMNNRPEQQLLCVECDHVPTCEEAQDIMNELKSRLGYYPIVNVIIPNTELELLDQFSENAYTVHYVTNCSTISIDSMKKTVLNHKTTNIARKLIIIDTPVSPLMIADSVGIDPTQVKLITLPNVPAIRACSIRHDRPYEYDDVAAIYEAAFK